MQAYRTFTAFFFLAASLLSSGCAGYPDASSYTSAAFREETHEYQFAFCLGCHVPDTIFTDSKIEPRSANLADGVNCSGCHLEDCKMSGPAPAYGLHPIADKNPFFRRSELCGKCHAGIFQAWQESNRREGQKTCQECHMHVVERKLIQDDPWQKIYPKRVGKQHLFIVETQVITTKNLLTMSFNEVVSSDNRIKGVLEIENTGIPHSVPARDYGYREVEVVIQLQDKAGCILDSKEVSLFVEMKTALQYKEKRDIPFFFVQNKDAYSIKATLNRTSLDKDINVSLIESTHVLQ